MTRSGQPFGAEVWRPRFTILLAACTWILIWIGALVTSTESGLAVPDWPLSYGMLMPPMVGGIFYEHGHRMAATFVGLLTVILAVWTWRAERRRWLRGLGLAALLMVLTQGVLGGITVIFLLPTPVSVAHATLAQTFLCVTVLIAYATSGQWARAAEAGTNDRPKGFRLVRLSLTVTVAVYVQLILGAVVRHTGAWEAIPDFPLAFGRFIPPLGDAGVVLQFIHRLGGVAVAALAFWFVLQLPHLSPVPRLIRTLAVPLALLVVAQIVLGGSIIWTERSELWATAHVAVGALILALSWLSSLCALRWYGLGAATDTDSLNPGRMAERNPA